MDARRLFAGAWLAMFLAACSSNSGPASGGQNVLPPVPPASHIKNVIVIIQENRSLVNFFAGYPGANAPASGCAIGQGADRLDSGSGCPRGDVSVPLQKDTFENNPGTLPHDWGSSMTDWDGGKMDGFSKTSPRSDPYAAYAYIDRSEIGPYWAMARQYVLADEMYPTEFGGSFTGHLTLVAGTDDIKPPSKAEVDFPSAGSYDCDAPAGTYSSYVLSDPYRKLRSNGPFPCFDQFNTMAQELDNAGVSWKFYAFTEIERRHVGTF